MFRDMEVGYYRVASSIFSRVFVTFVDKLKYELLDTCLKYSLT